VFFTRHMSLPVRLMGTAQLRTAMAWQQVDSAEKVQSWFLRDAPGSGIVGDLAPRDDEAVFDKLAMSAFAGTPLEMALRDLGVRSVAIVGVALEIGIAPTVSHAVDLGFIPVVVTDACGGRDHPAMQRVLDDFRFSGDALLTDIATITPLLEHV
jgi:biuret amidohydrolase